MGKLRIDREGVWGQTLAEAWVRLGKGSRGNDVDRRQRLSQMEKEDSVAGWEEGQKTMRARLWLKGEGNISKEGRRLV